jgi:hypothetical protein
MGLRVSKQDGKIKKSKSYQGELTESKRFITPASRAALRGVPFAAFSFRKSHDANVIKLRYK